MNCLNCGLETTRRKFCSDSCAKKESNRRYREKYPFLKNYKNARHRCLTDKKHPYYQKMPFMITKEQIKLLWYRDKAYLMDVPSIDRINNEKGYSLGNCRFMELKDNQSRRKFASVEKNI